MVETLVAKGLMQYKEAGIHRIVALRGDGPAPDPWGRQGWTMRQLYEKAQTPHAWFPALVEHCKRIGLPWFSSVFGPESLQLLEALDCPAYKIARLDNEQTTIRRDDMLGKVWLLNVFASWCVACREEHPLLVEFSRMKMLPIYGLNYKDERVDGMKWLALEYAKLSAA